MDKFNDYFQNYHKITFIGLSFVMIGITISYYRNMSHRITFDTINKNYKKKYQWENDLDIYAVSMPRFYISNPKKPRCLLLIGGYKDIPYVWNEIEKLFILDGLDFYAPRTFGNGRSFFQVTSWKDWVITYLEAIYLLQELYESIDIISFSTGSVIALYITQYKYKCKINNVFLCAPFLLYKPFPSIKLFFSKNILSHLLNRLCAWTIRFHPKSKSKFVGYRDTYNEYNSINDYCEIFGDIEMETTLFDFINFRPTVINASNVVIFYPNDDDVIGDINEQHKIISNVFKNKIDLISIPSYISNLDNDIQSETILKNTKNNFNNNYLPNKCGHVIFKEHPEIIQDIYNNFKKYIQPKI
jgi:hypothetical protein